VQNDTPLRARDTLQSQEILGAALQLPQEQHEILVDKLAASLELGDLGEYWEAEVQRRIEDVDAGRVATIPADVPLSYFQTNRSYARGWNLS
jgi:hypothetical protein